MKRAIILGAIVLAAAPAVAQGVNLIEGIYTGQGEGDLQVDLTHVDNDVYKISISTVVAMRDGRPGCGGGIHGEVKLDANGGNFFVENEDYDPASSSPMLSQRYCEIGVSLDGQGGMTLEERQGCIGYHGAACGFSGQLTHDAAGI